jgi:hypothetical protein
MLNGNSIIVKGGENMVKHTIDYDIIEDREHYVVYIEGRFFCTSDKISEAAEEIENYLAERR